MFVFGTVSKNLTCPDKWLLLLCIIPSSTTRRLDLAAAPSMEVNSKIFFPLLAQCSKRVMLYALRASSIGNRQFTSVASINFSLHLQFSQSYRLLQRAAVAANAPFQFFIPNSNWPAKYHEYCHNNNSHSTALYCERGKNVTELNWCPIISHHSGNILTDTTTSFCFRNPE